MIKIVTETIMTIFKLDGKVDASMLVELPTAPRFGDEVVDGITDGWKVGPLVGWKVKGTDSDGLMVPLLGTKEGNFVGWCDGITLGK